MVRAFAVVVLIGLADSLNPSTVAPAVYFSMARHAVRQVLAFTSAVFITNLVGGILLLVGPGHLLLDALPHPAAHKRHVLELGAGLVLVLVAAVVWIARHRLARGGLPGVGQKRAFATGASIMVVELPTAFPYFGAIAAIVASNTALPVQIGLVAVFNVLFVAPLLGIAILLQTAPRVGERVLQPAADWLERHWPAVFAALALVLGIALTITGIVGLS